MIVTNNDVAAPQLNTVTFYSLDSSGATTGKTVVLTGGSGIGGGFFAATRLAIATTSAHACVFASDAGSVPNDIAGINLQTQAVTGQFQGSATDSGAANGIGLTSNGKYLYASFSTSSTIATFKINSGCTLSFLGDVLAVGLNHGVVGGMAVRDNFLVVTYGDGSIESFDVSGGTPVAHGDVQYSAGASNDRFPNGIDITKDGHFVLFGDASTATTIEVSDITSGKLAPTTAYEVGTAWNSGNVRLSPDESLVFVTNDSGGQVTAAFFNPSTGAVTTGCTSPTLMGFYDRWVYAGGSRSQLSTGTGGLLYVPEFGSGGVSSIGVVNFARTGSKCTLTEAPHSPILDNKDPSNLMSIELYPGRLF